MKILLWIKYKHYQKSERNNLWKIHVFSVYLNTGYTICKKRAVCFSVDWLLTCGTSTGREQCWGGQLQCMQLLTTKILQARKTNYLTAFVLLSAFSCLGAVQAGRMDKVSWPVSDAFSSPKRPKTPTYIQHTLLSKYFGILRNMKLKRASSLFLFLQALPQIHWETTNW